MNEEIETIELSMAQAKHSIDMKNSFNKLLSNDNFKKIVTEGYFEKEATRLVLMRADPAMQADSDQKAINKQIDAVGYLRQYFVTLMHIGRMAEKTLADDENTREELLQEDLGQG